MQENLVVDLPLQENCREEVSVYAVHEEIPQVSSSPDGPILHPRGEWGSSDRASAEDVQDTAVEPPRRWVILKPSRQ